MPPKNKRSSATNSHDKRHENGLVQPATNHKLAKQRSIPRLNGHARDDQTVAYSSARTPELVATDGMASGGAKTLSDTTADPQPRSLDCAEDRAAAMARQESGSDSQEVQTHAAANGHAPDSAREGLAAVMSKASSVNELSESVIASRPLYDIVAILVLLLFVPPSPLVMLQIGFSYITWGPVTLGWHPSTWLQGSSPDTPSFAVTACLDFLFLLAIIIWPFGSDYILDFAQAIIAVKIGGGDTTKLLSPSNVTCLAIITGLHLTRFSSLRHLNFSFLSPILSKANPEKFGIPRLDLANMSFSYHPRYRNWIRIFFEAHIIVQGIIRVVRRSVEPPRRRNDSETTHHTLPVPLSNPADPAISDNTTAPAVTHELRHSASSSAIRDVRERSYRKRRRAEHIRRLQPFWAAIANARVSVAKDLEQTRALDDEGEGSSNTTMATAVVPVPEDRLWITKISDTEVHFEAVFFKTASSESGHDTSATNGTVMYARVNRARWSSLSVEEVIERGGARQKGDGETRFVGKISGLTAATSFWLEFVRPGMEPAVYSANLMTRPALNAATGAPAPPPSTQGLRPASPATTLKQSISTSEVQRDDQRSRCRKTRRDRRSTTNQLKREVDSLDGRLASSGGLDDRLRQRTAQLEQSIKHLETEAESTILNIEKLGDIPSAEQQSYTKAKTNSEANNARLDAVQKQVKDTEITSDSTVSTSRSARDNAMQKREKLEARITKNSQRQDDINNDLTLKQHEHNKKEHHRGNVSAWRDGKERELTNAIMMHDHARKQFENRRSQLEADAFGMNRGFVNGNGHDNNNMMNGYLGQPFMPGPSMLETPEQGYATLNHQNSIRMQNLLGTNHTPPVHSRRSSLVGGQKSRGRSSSMLSDISGLTEDEFTPMANRTQPSGLGFVNGSHPPLLPTANTFGGFPSQTPFADIAWSGDPARKRSSGSGSLNFGSSGIQLPQRTGSGGSGTIGQPPQRDNSSPGTKQSPIGSSRGLGSPLSNGR